jgi:hypothetical protein
MECWIAGTRWPQVQKLSETRKHKSNLTLARTYCNIYRNSTNTIEPVLTWKHDERETKWVMSTTLTNNVKAKKAM